jgi:hypothetical protein
MKTTSLLSIAALALVTLSASPAVAGTIKIGAAFDSPGTTVVTFDGLAQNADADTASALVDFDGIFGDRILTGAFADGGTASAANFVNGGQNINPFSFSFVGVAVNRVGWDAITNDGDEVTVSLWLDGVDLFESETFTTSHVGGGLGELFIGIERTNGLFDEVRVDIGLNGGTGAHLMNDLRFDVVAVPLPPAAYMGLGLLAGIAILRRRRRRAQLAL